MLTALDVDVLLHILELLDVKDILSLRQVWVGFLFAISLEEN